MYDVKHMPDFTLTPPGTEVSSFCDKLRAATELGHTISETLDYEKTLSTITNKICHSISDGCLIDMIYDRDLVRAATCHKKKDKNLVLMSILRGNIIHDVIYSNKRIVCNDLSENGDCSHKSETEVLRKLGVKSFVSIPLCVADLKIGAITFLNTENDKPFGTFDLIVLEVLVSYISSALHKSAQYERSLTELKIKNDLIGLCGHEIRTSLTTLKLQIQSSLKTLSQIESPAIKRPDVEKLLTKLNISTDYITSHVDKMHELNQTSQKLSLSKETLDLSLIVQEKINHFSKEFSAAKCQVVTMSFPDIQLSADKKRLESVIHLLLRNALKYGKGHPIEINLEKNHGHALISVHDYGPTIQIDYSSSLYFRSISHLSSIESESIKLELKLSKTVIEEHGGHMQVEASTDERKGNRFTIYLPLCA